MITNEWDLQSSIYLINDFCAETETFSYRRLAHFKFRGIKLGVNEPDGELTIVIGNEDDYQILQANLMPGRRFYQLLGLHFKRVLIRFGHLEDAINNTIYLETIALVRSAKENELRDINRLGARLRRTLNVALQGHIGVLKLHNDEEHKQLKKLWERGRIAQLLEQYGIEPFDDSNGELVKFWRPRRLEPDENIVIIID